MRLITRSILCVAVFSATLGVQACERRAGVVAERDALDSLRTRLKSLEFFRESGVRRLSAIEATISRFDEITLNPAEKSYQLLDTGAGTLLVSCENVQTYLDGVRITLKVGNPLLMTFHGFTVKATWGPAWVDTTSDYQAWSDRQHERSTVYTENLLPGRWNKVEFIASPAQPGEVKGMILTIRTGEVLLAK